MAFTIPTNQSETPRRLTLIEDYSSIGYTDWVMYESVLEDLEDFIPIAFDGTTMYGYTYINDRNSGVYASMDSLCSINLDTGVALVSPETRTTTHAIGDYHAISADDSRLYGYRYQYSPSVIWTIESYDPATLAVTGVYTISGTDKTNGFYHDPLYALKDYTVAGTAWGGHILNAVPASGVLTRTSLYPPATIPGYDSFYDASKGAPDYENNKVYFACWFDSDAVQVQIMCLNAATGAWSQVTPWVSHTGFDPYEAGDEMDLIFDPQTGNLILQHMHTYDAAVTWPGYEYTGGSYRKRLIGIDPVAETVEWTNVIIPSSYYPLKMPRGPYGRLLGDGKLYVQFAFYDTDSDVPRIAEVSTATGTLTTTHLPLTLWPDELSMLWDWYYDTLLTPAPYGFTWADRDTYTPVSPGYPSFKYALVTQKLPLGTGEDEEDPDAVPDTGVVRRQPMISIIGL
jgi:hypothetical protein